MNDEVKLTYRNMFFTWDDEKAIANWKKHKVDFRTAAQVFFDVDAIDRWDLNHNGEEDRRYIIGRVSEPYEKIEVLFVVYVERVRDDNMEIIRIISARPANRREIKEYERGLSR
ncbi:MAG: BrnT family toxin [Synergistaceae bacterium]|nr:BrnT family toxin [Synergistaceae bacterium]MBR0257447.1 BrnT family toxin [Synergistaceae bacterium]